MPLKGARKNQYQREWQARRRAEFFAGKSCLWCGATSNLELHHQDPSQKEDHRIFSWSKQRMKEEVAKCIILCRACHQRHHAEEQRGRPRVRDWSGEPVLRLEHCQ